MRQLLLLCLGLTIIGIQVLLGVQTFYPQAFASREDTLGELLEEKTSVLDKIAPEDLAWLAANPIVTVGVDPNFYPLEMFDERGRYTGLGGDYLRLLSKMTGLDFRPLATSDWAATEELARQGKVDLFMAAAKTGRRSEYMLFTAPYITEPGIIMTRRGSGLDQADMSALAGKKVAVVQDYSWHDFLKEFPPEVIAVPSATTLEALHELFAGARVNCAVLVTSLREVVTKRGDRMAFVAVEDFTGHAEVTFFPRDYAEARELIKSEQPLCLTARLESQGETNSENPEVEEDAEAPAAECKLLGQRVRLLADVCAESDSPIEVEIPAHRLGRADILALRTILESHAGEVEARAVVCLDGCHCHLRLGDGLKVRPGPELTRALAAWAAGEQNAVA